MDSKPYVPEFGDTHAEKIGWFPQKQRNIEETGADERFK